MATTKVIKKKASYSSEHIETQKFPQNVRASAAMYIGGVDAYGMWTITKELLDNGADEFMAGRNDAVFLHFDADGSYWVWDNGHGIPQGVNKHGMQTMQAVFGELHTSGKYRSEAYAVSIGSHGVGSKGTNATSEYFVAWTCFEKQWYKIGFKKGELVTEVTKCKAPTDPNGVVRKKGTLIHFKPDLSIFSVKSFPPSMAVEWAEIMAYMNPGLKITLSSSKNTRSYFSIKGPQEYIEKRMEKLKVEGERQMFVHKDDLTDIVIAFANYDGCDVRGMTNSVTNNQGGKHVDSVTGALYAGLKPFIKVKKVQGKPVPAFREADLREGLVGLVNAKLHKAQFSSQDKAKLTDDRVGKEFETALTVATSKFFSTNKALAQRIADRATQMNELKTKFTMSKKAAGKLNAVKRNGLPAKYAAFDSRTKVQDRELFLVEGDSAGGPTKEARFPYQAVLPLKGKIMNVWKDKSGKALESEEIINILAAIGYDVKAADPYSKLTVGKIICLADPDPDGPFVGDTKIRIRREDDGDLGMQAHEVEISKLADAQFFVPVWSGSKEIWAPATAELVRNVDTLIALEIAGTEYKVSEDHKFLCHALPPAMRGRETVESPFKDLVYVAAKHMRIGDRVYFPGNNGSRKPAEADKLTKLGYAPVSKMRIQKLSAPVPVYCLTVPQHHNFILPSGIVSSNCHINSLLLTLFYRYLPELFNRGVIHVVNAPEFYAIHKGQLVTGETLSVVQKKLQKIKAPSTIAVNHVKGYGELDVNVLRIMAMDPETRKLIKIKAIESQDRVDFVRLVDDDVQYRRDMLGLPSSVKGEEEAQPVKKVVAKTSSKKAPIKRVA